MKAPGSGVGGPPGRARVPALSASLIAAISHGSRPPYSHIDAEAEPHYKRALAIIEKALGPEHPDVAQSLENYAALLRKTGRDDEAVKLEARAKAIRAKRAERNTAN